MTISELSSQDLVLTSARQLQRWAACMPNMMTCIHGQNIIIVLNICPHRSRASQPQAEEPPSELLSGLAAGSLEPMSAQESL